MEASGNGKQIKYNSCRCIKQLCDVCFNNFITDNVVCIGNENFRFSFILKRTVQLLNFKFNKTHIY